MNYKIIGSLGSAAIVSSILVALGLILGPNREAQALNVLVLVFAASLGWLAGVAISPYTKEEATAFPKYAGAVSAFASGYLVSKGDRVVEKLLNPETVFTAVGAFHILGGISAFVTALLITYVFRAYAN